MLPPPPTDAAPKWLVILAPALLIGICSASFSVGLFVGRAEVRVDITTLTEQFRAHTVMDRHPGAVSSDVLSTRFAAMDRRLDRIEALLDERLP